MHSFTVYSAEATVEQESVNQAFWETSLTLKCGFQTFFTHHGTLFLRMFSVITNVGRYWWHVPLTWHSGCTCRQESGEFKANLRQQWIVGDPEL